MTTESKREVAAFLTGVAMTAAVAIFWPREEWAATTVSNAGTTMPARINLKTGEVQVSKPSGWMTLIKPHSE
jgi:hypothetical protein